MRLTESNRGQCVLWQVNTIDVIIKQRCERAFILTLILTQFDPVFIWGFAVCPRPRAPPLSTVHAPPPPPPARGRTLTGSLEPRGQTQSPGPQRPTWREATDYRLAELTADKRSAGCHRVLPPLPPPPPVTFFEIETGASFEVESYRGELNR